MANYNVKFTDRNKAPVQIPETEVNDTALDVTLFGRINPEYGETLDEDLLHLLENFACPELTNTGSYRNSVPNVAASDGQLANPTIGQLWFNSTRDMIYSWDGNKWNVVPLRENYAANWGTILDGQQLPKPVGPITGHVFDYADCIWSVAPSDINGKAAQISCGVDSNAVVTMRYRISGTNSVIPSLANYLIIGIRGNYNAGQSIPPIQFTPTPTPTMSATTTPTPTPTVTSTAAPTPTVTPTISVTPSATPAVSASPTLTPTPQPSSTPAPSATPTPQPSATPEPSPIPITAIILGGDYEAFSQVVNGATAGAGIGFNNTGASSKSGLRTSGPPRWLATGYNPADFEVSFSGLFEAQFPGNSWYSSPAGSNTVGNPSTWYNMGGGVAWSCGTTRDYVNFNVSYTIRQISTGRSVSGTIYMGGIAGTPI